MSSSGRPTSPVMTLNVPCTGGVQRRSRMLRSTNSTPISVDAMKFCRSLLTIIASSILVLSSWLTVESSSLIDCSSSLLVSSSSVVERSSSLIACSSSFDAFSSSFCVSYCSIVVRSWSLVLVSSASSCCWIVLPSIDGRPRRRTTSTACSSKITSR